MDFKAQGNKLYSQGKTQEAISAYGKGIDLFAEATSENTKHSPTSEEDKKKCLHMLYANRSMAHLDLCLVNEALQDADCAIEANPQYGKAYLRRALALLDIFKNKEAMLDLEKAEELDPGLAPADSEARQRAEGELWVPNCFLRKQDDLRKKYKCGYVVILVSEGGGSKAIAERHEKLFLPRPVTKELTESIRIGGCATLLAINLELHSRETKECQRNPEEWKLTLHQQLEREFGRESDANALGDRLYAQNHKLEAIAAYSKGIGQLEEGEGDGDTGLHTLYANRSMAHLSLCLVDEALQDAECAIEANPEYGKAYLRRAAVLLDLFKNKEALVDLDKAEELGESVEENQRKRALDQLWVPNCFLQKQIDLRNKYKCDYVIIVEHQSADGGDDDVNNSEIHEKLVLSDFSRRELDEVVRTGSGAKGIPGNIVVEIVEDPAHVNPGGSLGKQDREITLATLRQQMENEFGPKSDVFAEAPRAPMGKYIIGLHHDMIDMWLHGYKTRSQKYGGFLFPGAPKWLYDKTVYEKMVMVLGFETHNCPCCVSKGCPPCAREELIADRLQRFGPKGETKCNGCGEALTDTDPQECICGHRYCGMGCYKENWQSHNPSCLQEQERMPLSYSMTMRFWLQVAQGYFTVKPDEPDFVQLWKERGIEKDDQDALGQGEINFYHSHENDLFMAQRNGAASSKPDDAETRKYFVDKGARYAEIMRRWHYKLTTPLVTDSCCRLVAKMVLVGDIRRSTTDLDGTFPDDLTMAQTMQEFLTKVDKSEDPQYGYLLFVIKMASEEGLA